MLKLSDNTEVLNFKYGHGLKYACDFLEEVGKNGAETSDINEIG
jgi:hypothetical protein